MGATFQAQFSQLGKAIDYTPSADKISGDVVVRDNIVGIVAADVENGKLGALELEGVWKIVREASTAFTAGQAVWWDVNGNPEQGTAGTGAAVDNDGDGVNPFLGYALTAVTDANANLTVEVLLVKASPPNVPSISPISDAGSGALQMSQKTFGDETTGTDVSVFGTPGAPCKLRIIDVILENRAANGVNANLVQVCAAAAQASTISDDMALTGKADEDIVRATTIDASDAVIAAGGDVFLHVTKAGGTMGGNVTIFWIPVA